MNYEDTCKIVSDYLKENFTSYPLVPENRPFEPTPGQTWVMFGIRPNAEMAVEVSGKTGRVIGNIWFSIFLPENTGSVEANKVGDILTGLFFQKTIITSGKPSVICESASLRYITQEASGRQHWSVVVPYRVDAQVG